VRRTPCGGSGSWFALTEPLRAETEGSTRLTYTGLCGGLENLKIETKLKTRVKYRDLSLIATGSSLFAAE
jgi:hypothetical protein